jgi:hypothetical protein
MGLPRPCRRAIAFTKTLAASATAGKSTALRTMLKVEEDRGPDFLRLANAFSALFPKDSEENRLIDAMLLAMPR